MVVTMADAVRESTTLDAELDTVLQVVRDVASYPQWQEDFRSVDVLDRDDEGRPRSARLVVDARLFTTNDDAALHPH